MNSFDNGLTGNVHISRITMHQQVKNKRWLGQLTVISRFVQHYSGKLNIQNGGGAWLGSEVISIQNGGEGSIEYAKC